MVVIPVSSSWKKVGAFWSKSGRLMSPASLSAGSHAKSSWTCFRYELQMAGSFEPAKVDRLKKSQCPSEEKFGANSLPGVLIFGPRCIGGPHWASRFARWETQMSLLPKLPGRSELMYRLRPSFEIAG